MKKVFVYGTLLSQYNGEYYFKDSEPLGKGVTKDRYDMTGMGFPKTRVNPKGFPIMGEVFVVTDEVVSSLDTYEGYPSFYNRREVDITLEDGRVETGVWIYESNEAAEVFDHNPPFIKTTDGIYDWSKR